MLEDNRAASSVPLNPGITPEIIRGQLEKMLGSGIFAGSLRMARFLRFAVQEYLAGRAAQLKEVVIGARVFDRRADYDPRLDPIVRVEARRLRKKLLEYYATGGADDSIIIDFPKGKYSPEFKLRSEQSPAATRKDIQPDRTIAVLPLTNLDEEGGSDYFSDGLSEELLHALTLIPGLRVVAWNSAAQLRSLQQDIEEVGRRLGVNYALRGSVRRIRARLRITIHLIETATGYYIWSETYDRQIHDVFLIQEEIAASVAASLKIRLGAHELGKGRLSGHVNLECLQLCMKGRLHARERTIEGLRRSLVCFQQAVATDPRSASAYAGMADAHALLAEYSFADGADAMSNAKLAAEKALELDPRSAEAHASLGLVLALYDWSWQASENSFKSAIAINANYAMAHFWYSQNCLAMLNRLEESSEELEFALRLDPLSSTMRCGRGYIHLLAGRYDEALDAYTRIAEGDPSFYKPYAAIGRVRLQQKRYGQAIEMFRKAGALAGDSPTIVAALGQAQALAGDCDGAHRQLAHLLYISEQRLVPCSCFALIHLGLGDKTEALTWLERGVKRQQSTMVSMGVHPAYDDLRAEPRFQSLLCKIGLTSDVLSVP